MNASHEIQPSAEIPKSSEGHEKNLEKSKESPSSTDTAIGKRQPPQTSTAPFPPAPAAPTTTQIPVSDDSSKVQPVKGSLTSDLEADDNDLIEKQWVERAKAIVHQTQNDPRKQKDEMSKAKADYIKKRFNKAIPTDDTVRA